MQSRRYHHGDLRAALLTRAEQTLREKGADAVTLRQLSRDLCVSHAAPSRHFRDRQALLDALALNGFDRLGQTLAASQAAAGESFADRLRALAHAYVEFATANAELLDVMYTVKHDPAAARALTAAVQQMPTSVMALIADGQRRGEVRDGPPGRIGLPMFSTLHGFADLAVTDALSAADVESGLDDVVDYVLRGCAP